MSDNPIRVVLAKLGLDGHDRGIKIVARMLRDAGMEVIYLGLRQTAESIVAAAVEEDADVIGLSMHNAGHLTLAPAMLVALKDHDVDIPLVVGGIIPDDDVSRLLDAGVAAVLGPGASTETVVTTVRSAVTNTLASVDCRSKGSSSCHQQATGGPLAGFSPLSNKAALEQNESPN